MDTQIILNKLIQDEINRCEALHRKLKKQLPALPRGSIVTKRGQPYRAVRENGKQYFAMLTSDEEDLIRQLKLKRYISKAIPILEARIRVAREFLQTTSTYNPYSIRRLLPAQYHDLSDLEIFLDGDINYENWVVEDYRSNPMAINVPHFTAKGLKTRSKSEEIIGTRLEDQGFYFRYEPELNMNDKTVYPDFAILLKRRRRIVYWEHLGLIDDAGYVLQNLKKLEAYAKHGIFLGFNLIITYETKENPLTIVEVDQKIRELKAMDRI